MFRAGLWGINRSDGAGKKEKKGAEEQEDADEVSRFLCRRLAMNLHFGESRGGLD